MRTSSEVAAAYEQLLERIAAAGGTDVAILPVTKGFGPDAYRLVAELGCTSVGENYVQEVRAKIDYLPADIGLHLIGQLQRNKIKYLAGRVELYESVDRASLAVEIGRRDPGASVLIQVTTDDAPGKGGCRLDQLDALVEVVNQEGLDLRGLMTVGPTDGSALAIGAGFAAVRSAVDRLGLSVCSMGMSGDLELAVAEGTTQVRVGSDLFGPRLYPATNA